MTTLDTALVQAYDYALINPLQVDEDYWRDLAGQPVVPEIFKAQPHLFPLLVDLRNLLPERLALLVKQANTWLRDNADIPLLSALIQSQYPIDKLIKYLATVMRFWHQGQYRVLRFYDPRVFRHLCWLLDAEQLNQLLGPIRIWAWCEPDGSWHTQAGREELSPPRPLPLSQSQWGTIFRIEEINLSLSTLKSQAPELLSDPALANKLDHYLLKAEEAEGLLTIGDRSLYAEQAVRFHPRIHQHPSLRSRLEQVRSGAISYVGVCADLDDSQMHRLTTELDATHRDRP